MEQITASGTTITLVHFTYQQGEVWHIACMPNMTEFHQTMYHPNYQRSNDTRAVSCPACKKTQAFTDAKRALDHVAKK